MEKFKRLVVALRRHWKRLLIGSISAWLIVNWYLIMAIVALESNHVRYDDYTAATIAYFLLLVSFPAGALLAYSMRTKESKL